MAKKVIGSVKLQVKGGQANPSPPIGPALGQHGVNIAEFCKAFNARTQDQTGTVIPVVITIYADRSFSFITKTPPASVLLKQAAKVAKGSGEPSREKVGEVTRRQVEEIAKLKFEDLNAYDVEGAMKIIEGTARSMGMKETMKTVCTGVEMFRKILDQGQAGDNIGVLLRGTKREEVERGQVVAKPGSITPHTKFKAEAYILTKEEGGRHTPFFNGYRPQFYFRTTDVTGVTTLPEGVEMVMPGDNVAMEVNLITPIAMEKELRFAIREGGRTVGAGVISEIIE